MDFQGALICVLVFVVSGAILLLISMFGMKEKTYEEALAEQRKLTSGLLGTNQKFKMNKEKKQKQKEKKENKKMNKEKNEKSKIKEIENVEEIDVKEQEESVPTEKAPEFDKLVHSSHSKLHVEFDEPTVLESPPPVIKKRVKKEKIRPILLNKEKTPIADVTASNTLVNHFEMIHPKDDIELLHAHQEEKHHKHQEPEVKETKKSKTKKADKSEKTVEKFEKPVEKIEKEKVNETESKPQRETTKGSRNQKQSQLQQQPNVENNSTGETSAKTETITKVETSVPKPAPVIQPTGSNTAKDKKKKKSDLSTLQQLTSDDRPGVNLNLLMPLVRKADLSHSDIQNLIDMLLNKQHEAPKALEEWSEGRADPVQKLKKQLAEKERALLEEQEASLGLQNKLRDIRSEFNSERSKLLQNCRNLEETLTVKQTELQSIIARNHTQNQKIQQLQVQLNEEIITSRKLREEHNAFQMQRKNMDLHLQEAESNYQSQINQMRIEIQELNNCNGQLKMELCSLHDKSNSQMHHLKNEMDKKQEFVRQLEEALLQNTELRQQQLDEKRRAEKTQAQTQEELTRLHSKAKQQEENEKLIAQLKSEIVQLQEEKSKLEIANKETNNKAKEIEVVNLQNELSTLRAHLQQKESQLNSELEKSKNSVIDLQNELQEQRNKNDELRKKNWKVMEALNLAESAIRTKPKQTVCDTNEIKKQIHLEEQENYRKFIERLFPDINIPNSNQWMSSAEKIIKNYLSFLKQKPVPSENNAEVQKLKVQLTNYRTIIDDTEGMLNKLQTHVEQEERNWRHTLAEKDAEIESLKEHHKIEIKEDISSDSNGVKFALSCIEKSIPSIIEELQAVIEDLESRLTVERQIKQDLENDCEALRARVESSVPIVTDKHTQFANLLTEEKLAEENSRLTQELTKEQQRCRDLSEDIFRLQSINNETLHSKPPQNHTSNGTSLEIIDSEFSNSASSSTISTSSTKSRSSKNKKKKSASNN